jgi:hypothetical protein
MWGKSASAHLLATETSTETSTETRNDCAATADEATPSGELARVSLPVDQSWMWWMSCCPANSRTARKAHHFPKFATQGMVMSRSNKARLKREKEAHAEVLRMVWTLATLRR